MRLAGGLLGAHVSRRSEHLALEGHGDLARLALGQAEVHQARGAGLVDHDVGRLDVAMDHPLLVGIIQGVGQRGDQLGRLAPRGPANRKLVRQRRPLHKLAYEVRYAVRLTDVVNRHDRRVLKLGHAAGLALEAIEILTGGEIPRPRYLDRNHAVQLGIAGHVDGAEGPGTDRVDQDEFSQPPLTLLGAPGRRGFRLQAEARTTRGADDLLVTLVLDDFDRVPAMRAVNVHWTSPQTPHRTVRLKVPSTHPQPERENSLPRRP